MKHERPSKRQRLPYSTETYAEVRRRLAIGELQHDIAADLGWNQGRISEVKIGKRGAEGHQPSLL